MNELKNVKITRLLNAVAAGTTEQAGSVLDMEGYEGVMFIASFGTLTATQVTSLNARAGDASDGSDATTSAADLAGSKVGPLADGDSNKGLVLDVYRPQKRYIRPVIVRGTANAVIDGVWAIQYSARLGPTTQPTSVAASKQLASPAIGTA